VEVSASDLTTGFVGQAGQKTREMLTKARGKVLFVDEAYQLKPSPSRGFMGEVVDEMVKCLTSEDFIGECS
jgi:SpoVK/Ycf46/Vps4 family AAA+-type ATPase